MSARVNGVPGHAGTHPAHSLGGRRFADALRRTLAAVDETPRPGPEAPDARAALALQAAVYRHAERVELASRLLDHGVSAVKTVLQTRV